MADIILDRVTHIEFPNNPSVAVRNIHIESGSLLLEEILCESNIVFGETNATRFEATVYNLSDVAGYKIKVYQTDSDGNNKKYIFEGYVDSCKQDKDGRYRKVVAYDALYSIGTANVAGWWFKFWDSMEMMRRTEVPLWYLRNSLCEYAGIPYDVEDVVLHNDEFICTKTATLSSVSFNTMLRWICELQCTVPHIGRDGVLRFISFPNTEAAKDISDSYERNSSEFEGYVTVAIDTVELYDYDGNLAATTNTTGAVPSKNTYIIKDNALLFSLVDNEDSAADFVRTYLGHISHIQYRPCDINMIISDLDLSVGDYIKIDDTRSVILQNTLSGILLAEQEIQATGDEYLQNSSRTATAEYLSLQKRTEDLYNDIITDDLLNYAYMNNRPYDIENVITPIIELSISMPHTSNLVFLATVNLESVSTETREVQEVVKLGDMEYTMTRTEKVPVIVESFFEWNGAQILSNMPTETYSEDGKHLLNLMFFTIGGRQIGGDVTFKVFLRVTNGRVYIGENQVNATIISKGSSAGSLPWDGTITLEEITHPASVGTFTPSISGLSETITNNTQNPASTVGADAIGVITPEFGNIDIGGINDAMESSIN